MTLKHHSDRPEPVTERAANGGLAEPVENDVLREALQNLVRAEVEMRASPRVEEAVMRAWDAAHGGAPSRVGLWRSAGGAAVAATVALACTITLLQSRPPMPDTPLPPAKPAIPMRQAAPSPVPAVTGRGSVTPVRHRGKAGRTVATSAPSPPTTIVLVGGPMTAGEQVRVVRVRMARETLLGIGLRAVTTDNDETVAVDMLIGEDGVARGLRVGM